LPVAGGVAPNVLANESANDSAGRWKLMAGLASMVAVAVVGWHLASGDASLQAAPQLAAAPAGSSAMVASTAFMESTGVAGPVVMLRDARLDELLAAHKQFGGTSALQMPAGFLRNATFEPSSR
jgi:sigma-E factor negative regulatory protein RseA